MPEWRRLAAAPDAVAVGDDQQQASFGCQHAPYFAEQWPCLFGNFQAVNSQQFINGIVGERQACLFDEDGANRTDGGPNEGTLAGRHKCAKTADFAAIGAKVGGGKAEADQCLAGSTPPTAADLLGNNAPRDAAQRARVKGSEIENVEIHAGPAQAGLGHAGKVLYSTENARLLAWCTSANLEVPAKMLQNPAPILMPPLGGGDLILASGSRFRRQMLEAAGLQFQVQTATVDETAERSMMTRDNPAIEPAEVAMRLAALKAREISGRNPEALVIGADQVLALDRKIYGKPADVRAARAQLLGLRGRTHTLPTAVVLVRGGAVLWEHLGIAELKMRMFSDEFLGAYLRAASGQLTETVGGYALEGLGSQLFERIEGDYFTIIGLPLIPLLAELRRQGVIMA